MEWGAGDLYLRVVRSPDTGVLVVLGRAGNTGAAPVDSRDGGILVADPLVAHGPNGSVSPKVNPVTDS